MKKGIIILLLGIFSFSPTFTQDPSDLEKEMELLFQEMEKSFKQFENIFNDELMNKIDSFDIKKFGIDFEKLEKELEGKDFDNFSSEDLSDIMRLQMEMLQDVDLSQINDLLKSFESIIPNLESSPNKDRKEEENGKKTPPKKKRKTHKL